MGARTAVQLVPPGPRPRAGCRRSDYRRRCFLPQTRRNNMDSAGAGRVESELAHEGMGAGRHKAYNCKVFAHNDPHDVEVAHEICAAWKSEPGVRKQAVGA